MNDLLIKEALSYSLASEFHEAWRINRKNKDGFFEPRIKKSTDIEWNMKHGTDAVDIASCDFSNLPFNWQYENLEAAKVVIDLVYDDMINGNNSIFNKIEVLSSFVHDAWLKRNEWVYDPNYGNPNQAVSYNQLSEEEKSKDRVQVLAGIKKVNSYLNNEIDIESIIDLYSIEKTKGKKL